MTKEELKEAIAATITENGQKGITGQALANLLNEIVDAAGDAAGEGGGGGGNVLSFDLKIDMETGEPILPPSDENLQFRQTLIEGLTNNKPYIVFVRLVTIGTEDLGGVDGDLYMVESYVAKYTYGNAPDAGIDELFLEITVGGRVSTLVINSDGSITLQ